MTGPSTHSFANIGFADLKQTSFQTFLSWEVGSLLGPSCMFAVQGHSYSAASACLQTASSDSPV